MHSTPEYRSKPEVKSCQINGYCLLLRLKAECLLNNVKWVMNDSSMFSLIVWKNLREGESLFCFCLFCWLDMAENDMI